MTPKNQAERLFFEEQKTVPQIADALGKDPKTIRAWLRAHEGYAAEKQRRKLESQEKRKAYQARWARQKTGRLGTPDEEKFILANQHRIDVAVLSREMYGFS